MNPSELVWKLCGFCLPFKVQVASSLSLKSGRVVAINSSQTVRVVLFQSGVKSPIYTGALHPPFEKVCLNGVPVYRRE